jgi:hypothetical protein
VVAIGFREGRGASGVGGLVAAGEPRAVGVDAVVDRGVVAAEERTNLGQAEVVFGILAKGPPDLVSGGGNGPCATAAAQVGKGYAATAGDLLGDTEQVTGT